MTEPTTLDPTTLDPTTFDTVRRSLTTRLGNARGHVLDTLTGLDDDTLRRAVLPSGWSALGMIHHLHRDVEQFWFGCVMGGDPEPGTTDAWQVPDGLAPADVIEGYRSAVEAADAVIAASALDQPPRWWPTDGRFGDYRLDDLAAVMLHVLLETATHAGHLDAWRELVDGRQSLVLG